MEETKSDRTRVKELQEIFGENFETNENYLKEICKQFCSAAFERNFPSLLYLSSLAPSHVFLNYKNENEFPIMRREMEGWSPLHFASSSNSNEIINFLLNFGFEINEIARGTNENSFLIAIKNLSSIDFLKNLIEKGVNIHHEETGEINSFLALIKRVARMKKIRNFDEIYKLFQFLVDIKIDYKKETKKENLNAILLFLQLAPRLTSDHFNILKYLIEIGIDVHKKTDQQKNALHFVAEKGSIEMIRYFVSLGLDLHSIDQFQQNVLFYAIRQIDLEILQYFISLNINFHLLNDEGENILFSLISNEDIYFSDHFDVRNVIKMAKYLVEDLSIDFSNFSSANFDIFLTSLQKGYIDLIKYIYSLSPDQFKYENKSIPLMVLLVHSSFSSFRSKQIFDEKIFQFLIENDIGNEFYHGHENRFYILHHLVGKIVYQNIPFLGFKRSFDFFLKRGNGINEVDANGRIPIMYVTANNSVSSISHSKLWKIIIYLINKESDLLFESKYGSILHWLLNTNMFSVRYKEILSCDVAKYVVIRSLEFHSSSRSRFFPYSHWLRECRPEIRYLLKGVNRDKLSEEGISEATIELMKNAAPSWKSEMMIQVINKLPPILEIKDFNGNSLPFVSP